LITQENRFIAQFHITEEFLSHQSNIIRTTARSVQSFEPRLMADGSEQVLQIKDLRIGMKKVSLKAKIEEVSAPTFVVTRFGNCASVANAVVSDETGQIKLCLWNDQITSVKPGDMVQIENASVSEFRHERQMRIGKKGTLRIEVKV
jgi:replication factor A1